jgi:sugar phosphate isomerase/epimerase
MMSRKISFGLAVSEEILGDGAPVLLQGGLENAITQASGMGFDSVEMHIREPLRYDAEKLLKHSINKGIRISAIGTGLEYSLNGLSLTSPDKQIRNTMKTRLKEHIEFASVFNDAVVFIGLCRGKSPDFKSCEAYLSLLAEELVPIVAYASECGVILGFEPIVFYLTNLINTTDEALEFLKRPGLGSMQLLLDTHHMFIEDRNIEQSFKMCRGRIAHVHISDSNRKYPGSGNIDYKKIGSILKDINYENAVSLEVLPYPDGVSAAMKGLQYMRKVFNCL